MNEIDRKKTPRKPTPTAASTEALLAHYNQWVGPYNEALSAHLEGLTASAVRIGGVKYELQQPYLGNSAGEVTREQLIELIQRQNHRLNRHIKPRAIELLMVKLPERNADGRTVGLTYADILSRLACEFPEGSTSAACLRWYVVHLRADADAEGLPWPDLPQVRPRSPARRT